MPLDSRKPVVFVSFGESLGEMLLSLSQHVDRKRKVGRHIREETGAPVDANQNERRVEGDGSE